jgi:hypothetical protein
MSKRLAICTSATHERSTTFAFAERRTGRKRRTSSPRCSSWRGGGGETTLKDFAFALLVGVASGAYSSIFIAAPLLAWWKEREPEYHRRKGSDSTEGSIIGVSPRAAAE